jgi:exopolysaccharide biosynthesis protein
MQGAANLAIEGKTARRSRARLVVLLSIAALIPLALLLRRSIGERSPIHIVDVQRTPLCKGIEMVVGDLRRGSEPGGRLVALYFDPKEVAPTLLLNDKQVALGELAQDALAVVNAGFFTKERKPTGLLVSEGRVLSPFVAQAGAAGSGVFIIEEGGPKLVERDKLTPRTYERVALAIQAGPRIIEPNGGYGIVSDDGARANRTLMGTNEEGLVIIAVVLGPNGWASGPTLYEVQSLIGLEGLGRHASQLAFRSALNLDGGPSTGMHVRSQSQRFDAPESAPVHSVLALKPRQ